MHTRVAGLPIFSQELFLALPRPLWLQISALGGAASSKGLNVSCSYSPALPPFSLDPPPTPALGTPQRIAPNLSHWLWIPPSTNMQDAPNVLVQF